MAAHQAPLSLGFSRQEYWSGCHFLLQCMKLKSESVVAQPCPTLSDPMDCSLPGSSVHGIFQARVLEWGAIAFSARSHMPQQRVHMLHLRIPHLQQRSKIPTAATMTWHSQKKKKKKTELSYFFPLATPLGMWIVVLQPGIHPLHWKTES